MYGEDLYLGERVFCPPRLESTAAALRGKRKLRWPQHPRAVARGRRAAVKCLTFGMLGGRTLQVSAHCIARHKFPWRAFLERASEGGGLCAPSEG